ncbi:hypothetical protein G7046_g3816 [Stylonectria norvegica]|nr:hypothetical protein G7046_g3816 [Stylonectria norvegica]
MYPRLSPCLAHGLKVYETTLTVGGSRRPDFAPEDFLNLYVNNQLSAATRYSGCSPLRGCVAWCAEQLRLDLDVPAGVAGIPAGPEHSPWRDNIHLFCTLWHAMLRSLLQDDGLAEPPTWYLECEAALAVSPSELLVTVCWMIGKEAHVSDPGAPVLQRASAGLDAMGRWTDGDLWSRFLRRFTWMNQRVDLPDKQDEAFEAAMRHHTRQYIVAALGVDLPVPVMQAVQAEDYMLVDISGEASFLNQLSGFDGTFDDGFDDRLESLDDTGLS